MDGAVSEAVLMPAADAIASVEMGEWDAKGVCEAPRLLVVGGSTCCSVELKYRAWLGRRNVGGSVDEGTRTSCTARLNALLNIFGLECGLRCQLQELIYKSSQFRALENLKIMLTNQALRP